jgi:hypothetical protein
MLSGPLTPIDYCKTSKLKEHLCEVYLFDSSLHSSSRIPFLVDDKGKHLSAHTKEAIWQRIQPSINQQHVHTKGTVLYGEML